MMLELGVSLFERRSQSSMVSMAKESDLRICGRRLMMGCVMLGCVTMAPLEAGRGTSGEPAGGSPGSLADPMALLLINWRERSGRSANFCEWVESRRLPASRFFSELLKADRESA